MTVRPAAPAEPPTASALVAELRKLHRPFGIHDECSCDLNDDGHVRPDAVVNCGDYETCSEPMWFICAHCCTTGDDCYPLEVCADSHKHGPGKPICETAAILDNHVPAGVAGGGAT